MTERRAAVVLAILAAGVLLGLAALRPGLDRLWGDEGTYVEMSRSLAFDGDLRFDARDRARAAELGSPGLILEKTPAGAYAYSKPVLYPLVAAPLVRVLGPSGLIVLNVLALGAGLGALGRRLRRIGPAGRADLLLVTFAATGALLPYLLWRMTEAFEVGLVLVGLVLALPDPAPAPAPAAMSAREGEPSSRAPSLARGIAGALLLGLAASLRYPNLALAQAPALVMALRGQRARALGFLLAVSCSLLLVLGVTHALTGHMEPYGAIRAGFDGATGYPGGAEHAESRFTTATGSNDVLTRPRREPRTMAYAALYFFIGRHTGLLVYYPVAALLAWGTLRRIADRTVLPVVLGSVVALGFYLAMQPENYFGGATFVGNRYVLPMVAALAAVTPALPTRRALAACSIVAALTGTSALASVASTGAVDAMSQSHANAGVWRWLPYESTAPELDGGRDRYWSHALVRFVDPFATVDAASFRLRSGAPGADLLVVTDPGAGPLNFLVAASAPSLELRISEMGFARRYPVGPMPGGARSVVAWRPLPAWRRHPFWWQPRTALYDARVLRLSVSCDRPGEEVTLRYLGDAAVLGAALGREVLAAELPAQVEAATRSSARVVVRNTSDFTWSPQAVLPVQAVTRVSRPGGAPGAPVRTPLPGDVPPQGLVTLEVPIEWPAADGPVTVTIDLVLEEVAFFADRNGGVPLLERVVEVRAATPAGGPAPAGPGGR